MPDPILICSYSHKGGVGKTTTAHNISDILSRDMGFKVLLIDADPQCSLSSLVLRKFIQINTQNVANNSTNNNVENNTDEHAIDDRIHEYIDKNYAVNNIYSCFSPLCEQSANAQEQKNQGIEAQIKSRVDKVELLQTDDTNKNFYFLPGNKSIYKLEAPLTTAFANAESLVLYKGVNAMLGYYLRELAKRYAVDIVIVDLNPGSTILNASLLLSSDYFIVPITPDYFSKQAIWSLSNILPTWEKMFKSKNLRNMTDVASPRLLPKNPPRLLGVIPQRVKTFKNKPPKAVQQWLDVINEELEQSLCRGLKSYEMLKDGFLLFKKYHIPKIGPVLIEAQRKGIPVTSLNDTAEIISIKECYIRVIAALFVNLDDRHITQLKLQNKLQQVSIPYQKFIKEGRRVSFVNSDASTQYNWPLPLSKSQLIGFLRDQQEDELCKAAIVSECLSIDPTTLNQTSLVNNENLQEYQQACSDIYQEILKQLQQLSGDLYHSDFKKIQKIANELISESFELSSSDFIHKLKNVALLKIKNNLTVVNNKQNDFSDEPEESPDDSDSLQNQLEKINNILIILEGQSEKYYSLKVELRKKLNTADFIDYYVSTWLRSPEAFLQFKQGESGHLISYILKKLNLKIIVRNYIDENDQLIDLFLNEEASMTCFLEKIEDSEKYIESKTERSKYNLPLISNQIADPKSLTEYKSKWEKPVKPDSGSKKTPKIVAAFNHKGGVAKTTTCQNLAWMMGKAGYKVLIIDTDTQCNLSSIMMGVLDYQYFYDEQKHATTSTALRTTYGLLYQIAVKNKTIDPATIEFYKTRFPNVYLLPSSTAKFVEVEFAMSDMLQIRKERDWRTFQDSSEIFHKLAEAGNFDVVIIDMCPSISAINEMLLMQSGFFITPVLADYLSLQAIRSLPSIIKEWATRLLQWKWEVNEGSAVQTLTMPKLLQFIPNRYSFTKDHQPSKVHLKYLTDMLNYINNNFVSDMLSSKSAATPNPPFSDAQKLQFEKDLRSLLTAPLKLLQGIPDYTGYGLRAQESHAPLVDAPYAAYKADRMSQEDYQTAQKLYRERYQEIVDEIVAKTGLEVRPKPALIPIKLSRTPAQAVSVTGNNAPLALPQTLFFSSSTYMQSTTGAQQQSTNYGDDDDDVDDKVPTSAADPNLKKRFRDEDNTAIRERDFSGLDDDEDDQDINQSAKAVKSRRS